MNSITTFILKTYSMELILCFTLNIIGHVMMAFSQNYLACSLTLQPLLPLGFFSANTSMFLSVSRCYIKKRAEESKFVNPKKIVTWIKKTKIVCYIVVFCLFVCLLNPHLGIHECANVPFYEINSKPYVFYTSVLVCAILLVIQFLVSIASELTLNRCFIALCKQSR